MAAFIDYEIERLQGKANWYDFEYGIKAVWMIDGVWGVVCGGDPQPIEPQKPASVSSGIEDSTITQAGQDVTTDEL